MESILKQPNFNFLKGEYGTPSITIAFMIKRYEDKYYPDEKPPLSGDTSSTIRRALELEFYDDLYIELFKKMILTDSTQATLHEKESAKRRITEILDFLKYDILDKIECLDQQIKQGKIDLIYPFLNKKIYFSGRIVNNRLEILRTKFLLE
jgi:predicted nucleotidyltransferase